VELPPQHLLPPQVELLDEIQPCALSASMSTPINDIVPFSWYDGSWTYIANSGGGDSVVRLGCLLRLGKFMYTK
jgi:hypothetical protein